MAQWLDGNYSIEDIKESLEKSFNSEKELCDFIELNIKEFTTDCLGLKYNQHVREHPLYTTKKRSIKGNRRIDFLIMSSCGKRIGVECKTPTYDSELSSAVGQALAYMSLFEHTDNKLDKIAILSTKVDFVIPLIIKKFNLPIDYICIDKKKHLTLIRS